MHLLLLTERPAMARVLEHVVQGNSAPLAEPAFVRELKSWIRFNAAQAVPHRSPPRSASLASPPTWWCASAEGRRWHAPCAVRRTVGSVMA